MRSSRGKFLSGFAFFILILAGSFFFLLAKDELSFGRNPLQNFVKTVVELGHPSFTNLWYGSENLEYVSDDGTVLRTENQKVLERNFLMSVARALGITFAISTLGTALASLLAFPLAIGLATNIPKPKILSLFSKLILDSSRSVHTLVFGLLFVGIVGRGPTAGILAIAAHSMGSFGKLFSESIETINKGPINAIKGVGASSMQVFSFGVIPEILPQFVSTYLYLWEFNTRDSTVLGLIGAGGLGLLISEAISLFQWGRLGTLLLVIVLFVMAFDSVSRRLRQALS